MSQVIQFVQQNWYWATGFGFLAVLFIGGYLVSGRTRSEPRVDVTTVFGGDKKK